MGRCTLSLFTSWERAVITSVHVTAVPLLAAGGSTCRGQIFNVRDAGVVAVTRCCSNSFSLSREVLFSVHVACFCPQTRKREASPGRLCSVCMWPVSVLRRERERHLPGGCVQCACGLFRSSDTKERGISREVVFSVHVVCFGPQTRKREAPGASKEGIFWSLIKNEQQKVHCQRSEKKIQTNKQTNKWFKRALSEKWANTKQF